MNCTNYYGFNKDFDSVVKSIITPVRLRQSSYISNENKELKVNALWDTGATHSVIKPALAKELGLVPIDKATVCGVNSCEVVNVYWVDIYIPNDIIFENVAISDSEFSGGDILIGMDIIQKGDFIISNAQGKTHFSFCVPPRDKPIYLI